jgi:cytochrome d ubiquinol oxidase subunit I
MAGLGILFMLLTLIAVILSRKERISESPLFLRIMLYSLPLPYIATQLGWVVAEVGRHPWLVYNVLSTADGVSRSISVPQVAASLAGFTLLYSLLALIDLYLLIKFARKGPDNDVSSVVRIERQEV